jgi:hypothetical protein
MRIIIFVLSVITVVLLNQCSFPLEESDIVPVAQEDPNLTVTILPDEGDTLILDGYKLYELGVEVDGNGEFYAISGWLNGKPLFEMLPGKSFSLNTTDQTPGYYTLKIRVFYRSGERSLSNTLITQYKEFDYKWTVWIPSPPEPVLLRHTIEDGRLKLFWEKPAKLDVINYVLYKNNTTSITLDASQLYHIDSAYVGGDIEYSLTTFSTDHSATSRLFISYPGVDNINFEWVPTNSLMVRWTSSLFYENIQEIEINDQRYADDAIFENLVTFSEYLPFGSERHIAFNLYSWPDLNLNQTVLYSAFPIFLGERFQMTSKVFTPSNNQSIYAKLSYGPLARLDAEGNILSTMNDAAQIYNNQHIAVSDEGTRLAIRKSNTILFLDPTSLTTLFEVDVKSLINEDYFDITRIRFLTNNLIQFSTGYKTYVLDLQTLSLVFSLDGDGSISPEQSYMVANNAESPSTLEFFRLLNGGQELIRSEENAKILTYIDSNHILYYVNLGYEWHLRLFDLSTNTLIYSKPLQELATFNHSSFDISTNRILFVTSDKLIILNYTDGSILYSEDKDINSDGAIHLYKDQLISERGFKISLEELMRIRGY